MNLDIQCVDEKSISNVGNTTDVCIFGYDNRYRVINDKVFLISHLFNNMPSHDDLVCIPRIDFVINTCFIPDCIEPSFEFIINALVGIDISDDNDRKDYFFILSIKSKKYNRSEITRLLNNLLNKLKELFKSAEDYTSYPDTSDYLSLLCNASTDVLQSNIKLTTSLCNSYKINKMLDDGINVKYLLNYDGNTFTDFKYVKNEHLKRYFHLMGWCEIKPLKYNVYNLSGVIDKTGLSYLYQKLKTRELCQEVFASENKSAGSVVLYCDEKDYYYTNFVTKMIGEIDLLGSEKYIYTVTVLIKTELPDDEVPERNNIFVEFK